MSKPETLRVLLRFAIPLHAAELRRMSTAQVEAIARECGKSVAHPMGDLFLRRFRSGERAKQFNALARGLAALTLTGDGERVSSIVEELCNAVKLDEIEAGGKAQSVKGKV